ncbi:MAG: TonB-dependent receptor [Gemmatimonadota bacterium]|jgi:iron complex outermembrane receptor protein|nr:TonB-dependent receptor [Gemmatimonadota bacterium]
MLHALSLIAATVGLAAQDTVPARPRPDTLETVVVRATRAGAAARTSQSQLSQAAIDRVQAGQDAPLLLQSLTGVTTSSDAGGYSGYSYLRLRGIDQTRLTISLDGVPLNDPEDQVLYFSNVPDFLNSIESVRVQRGVGSSGFGTASFGGSLNFESVPVASTPRFGEVQLTGGSYGTGRTSLEGATGLTNGFAAYARVSAQTTDGYRAHSGNDALSGFLSAGWFGARDAVKLTGFAGRSKTQLAYYAASEPELALDRRANPMSPEEKDDFHQEMVSLQYTHALGTKALVTATGYRNSAAGNYDVAVGDELWNFNLSHAWYGLLTAVNWTGNAVAVSAGAHVSTYERDHYLFVRPDLATRIYDNSGAKQEQSGFVKATWQLGAVDLRGDLELRRAAFQYHPTPGSSIGTPSIDWVFLNPKLGLTWRAAPGVVAQVSVGRTSREPTRSDMFAGADDVDDALAPEVLPLDRVKPESVTDVEAGVRWSGRTVELGFNAFTMQFRDEIAPIGAITITGTPLRKNVDRSYRSGVELEGTWRPGGTVTLTGNTMLMRARIAEYTDDATGATYLDVPPLLSPAVVTNLEGRWQASRVLELGAGVRYVGQSQLANDGSATQVLPAATLADLRASVALGRFEVRAQALNLFDANAYASGYTDGTTRYFFPVAERTVLTTLVVRW